MSDQQAQSNSSLTPTHGVLLVIGTSAVLLLALGFIFRTRGE
jgi:hypothetical protein